MKILKIRATYILGLALCLICTLSCTKKLCINQSYISSNKRHTITFNTDSTFFYEYRFGWHNYTQSFGSYSIDNVIKLNSKYMEVDSILIIPAIFTEEHVLKSDSVTLEVFNKLPEDSIYLYTVFVNGKECITTKNKTIKFISIKSLQSIRISISLDSSIALAPKPLRNNIMTNTYQIQDRNTNRLAIHWDLSGNDFLYETINNETIELKGRKLYWVNRKIPLVRTHTSAGRSLQLHPS